jgi:hypothetical protein
MADFRVRSSIVGFGSGIVRPFFLEVSRRRGAAGPILCTGAIDPDLRQFCSAFNDAGFHGGGGRAADRNGARNYDTRGLFAIRSRNLVHPATRIDRG